MLWDINQEAQQFKEQVKEKQKPKRDFAGEGP